MPTSGDVVMPSEVGRGSTFTLYLPRATEAAAAASAVDVAAALVELGPDGAGSVRFTIQRRPRLLA